MLELLDLIVKIVLLCFCFFVTPRLKRFLPTSSCGLIQGDKNTILFSHSISYSSYSWNVSDKGNLLKGQRAESLFNFVSYLPGSWWYEQESRLICQDCQELLYHLSQAILAGISSKEPSQRRNIFIEKKRNRIVYSYRWCRVSLTKLTPLIMWDLRQKILIYCQSGSRMICQNHVLP